MFSMKITIVIDPWFPLRCIYLSFGCISKIFTNIGAIFPKLNYHHYISVHFIDYCWQLTPRYVGVIFYIDSGACDSFPVFWFKKSIRLLQCSG